MNRLAQSQSLYLRKHATNPIDWWTWCDEALATAKSQNLPIFLSIGYSSCHWCTVMEGEAFSDLEIAAYMNAHFLPIKVDREERPDLDSFYMQALQLMTGSKGWPLNLFLAPEDQMPFYAGTYFPAEAKYGRPGFLDVLQRIHRLYDTEFNKVSVIKTEILSNLQKNIAAAVSSGKTELSADLLYKGITVSVEALISTGKGACFPMIPFASTALRAIRFNLPTYNATEICRQRGLDLALGGIFDHVGGGFHRYTVDFTWTVPHFEKMLHDSGQIIEYLADLWSAGMQEPAFERAVVQTVAWLKREMTAPQGYFYAAQDADSFATSADLEPTEGTFYLWSYAELTQCLSQDELQALTQQFTVNAAGNVEGAQGLNVLQRFQPGELSAQIESALSKLFAIRYGAHSISSIPVAHNSQEARSQSWPGRIPPVTDTKMIVDWNSVMISGLARAATIFQQSEYLQLAATAAHFILEHQFHKNRLHRISYYNAELQENQPLIIAQAKDYALLIKALLDLEAASTAASSASWLAQAIQIQQEFNQYLWSPEFNSYHPAERTASSVIQERSCDDAALPSANGVAASNLVRLFLLTKEMAYLDRAEQILQTFSKTMVETPERCPSLFAALDWFRNQMLIQTHFKTASALSLQYLPTAICQLKPDLAGDIAGLICQRTSCLPAATWEEIQAQVLQKVVSQNYS